MATTTAVPAPPPAAAPLPVDETALIPKKLVRARPLFDPEILRRALKDSVVKLNPVTLMKNPVIFVVEIGAALVLVFLVRDIATGAGGIGFELQIDLWLWFTVAVRDLCRSDGRGPRQGAGGHPAQDPQRYGRQPRRGRRTAGEGLVVEAPGRRCRRVQRGRGHSRGRRGDRRDRDGRRVGDHRRERAGDSRVGRRSQRRDGRHAGPLGHGHGQDHLESRRDVPGSHDRARRGC